MELLVQVNDCINSIVWGVPTLVLIFFTGLYFTIRLGFFQFVHPIFFIKETFMKSYKERNKDKDGHGEISSFQAAMTSVSAIVGTGNIAGVATAVALGGPGALFWMVVAALFGMATKFAEITLGVKYREVAPDGSVHGGTMYYLHKGLHQKALGIFFSILVIPCAFVISGIVDTNTIALTLNDVFGVPTLVTGITLAIVVGFVIFGGVQKIGSVCSYVAPFMGGAYILSGLLVILFNITEVPAALVEIVRHAFMPTSLAGGAVGTVVNSIRYGVARGIFSNEAGLGTAAMVHAGARVNHPVEQGVWGPVEVFLDTILVCMVTGLVIVISGLWNTGLNGATLTVAAFDSLLPGNIGATIVVGSVILFGFTCLISYYIYVERAVKYIFGSVNRVTFRVLWLLTILLGSQTTLGLVWSLADTVNGMMIIPNLIGILLLSNEVVKLKKEYFKDNLKKN